MSNSNALKTAGSSFNVIIKLEFKASSQESIQSFLVKYRKYPQTNKNYPIIRVHPWTTLKGFWGFLKTPLLLMSSLHKLNYEVSLIFGLPHPPLFLAYQRSLLMLPYAFKFNYLQIIQKCKFTCVKCRWITLLITQL